MAAKTPVSILQEMMIRLGAPPKYDLIFDGSGTHTAVFKYRVYANDVSAIGSGRSKKEAKHEAARIALEKLALSQIEAARVPGAPYSEPIEVITPYKDKLAENAVGALHEMCATNEIPMPEYEMIDEHGAPHAKTFTFVCSVSKQKERGIGRTKKQAKQLAAFNMMNRLKESLGDVINDLQPQQTAAAPLVGESFENAITRYVSASGAPRRKFRLNRSPSKYHNFFCETPEEFLDAARKILSEIKLPVFGETQDEDIDWMSHMNRILDCLDVPYTVVPGKDLMNGQTSAFLVANLASEAVFYGFAQNGDQALQQAAYNGLLFLNTHLIK